MTTPIFGVDAASMQQRVDWATVDSITAFGFEKTIQGTGYTNPYWADAKTQMLARAAATGFVPGAYMFLEQGNATAQANHFAAVAGDLDGFALFADIEPTGSSHPPWPTRKNACSGSASSTRITPSAGTSRTGTCRTTTPRSWACWFRATTSTAPARPVRPARRCAPVSLGPPGRQRPPRVQADSCAT